MGQLWTALMAYLLCVNVLTFSVYGADKRKARRGAWRTPERTLLALALAGGGLGALAAMRMFRHKTRHRQFQVLVPLSVVLWAALMLAVAWWTAQV